MIARLLTVAIPCVAIALAQPAFEVASVKPSEPVTPAMVASGKIHVGMKIDGKRVDIGNFSLMQLICKAYDVKSYQVTGPASEPAARHTTTLRNGNDLLDTCSPRS